MDKIQAQRFGSAVREFLLSKRSREVLVFIVFVVISAAFWLMETMNEVYTLEVDVPLRLTNVPEDVVITQELPPMLRVKLRDKGTILFQYRMQSAEKRAVSLDFASYDGNTFSGRVNVSLGNIQHPLQAMLEPTTNIISVTPDTLYFYYSRARMKRVPVEVQGNFEPDYLHFVVSKRCTPDSVNIWAPHWMIDTITKVRTKPIVRSDMAQDESFELPLVPVEGVKCEPAEVNVSVKVDSYVAKSIEVPVRPMHFPKDYALTVIPTHVTVSFSIGSRQFDKISSDDFIIPLEYDTLMNLPEGSKYPIVLSSAPSEVKHARLTPDSVSCSLFKIQ